MPKACPYNSNVLFFCTSSINTISNAYFKYRANPPLNILTSNPIFILTLPSYNQPIYENGMDMFYNLETYLLQ